MEWSVTGGQMSDLVTFNCFSFSSWPTYLFAKGYVPSTVRNMLKNVVMFLRHTENTFHKASKLREKDFRGLHYELKRIVADVQKKVVVHQQKVLRRKTGKCFQSLPVWYCLLSENQIVHPLYFLSKYMHVTLFFTDNQLLAADEKQFMMTARKRIPELFGK